MIYLPSWRSLAHPQQGGTLPAFRKMLHEPQTSYHDTPEDLDHDFGKEMAWEEWHGLRQNEWVRHGVVSVDKPEMCGAKQWFLMADLTEKGRGMVAALTLGQFFDVEDGRVDRKATFSHWNQTLRYRYLPCCHAVILKAMADVDWMRPLFREFVLFRLAADQDKDGNLRIPSDVDHPLLLNA